jgi:hypothetical protein
MVGNRIQKSGLQLSSAFWFYKIKNNYTDKKKNTISGEPIYKGKQWLVVWAFIIYRIFFPI